MKIIKSLFERKSAAEPTAPADISGLLNGFSVEVLPKTVGRLLERSEGLPARSRVYIAYIQGTDIVDMVSTARRLTDAGFEPMPHIPARLVKDRQTLSDWVARYKNEAGVHQALVIGGGVDHPVGEFSSSIELMATGVFQKAGFDRLHVAGHPEGNRDIDPDGTDKNTLAALRWKQEFSEQTGVDMAIVTQFSFDSQPVIEWAQRLSAEGIRLPIHIGVPGPAKLQTLIRYALHCGIGPSIRVLHRRAADVTRMMLPFTPEEFLNGIAHHKAANPGSKIAVSHFFPLGGIDKVLEWNARFTREVGLPDVC
ncbi:methylenetetrahydrofolate reductase [Aminobacter sp. P9b]|uniref:Methylenetetrahydrofolate reductase (NADPH) n=1 Tax=Aminobacter ciceronei TaxID=150723 RepID=A0ABR6CAJ0_9HYPH|nr:MULTISPECIES: methylenetetrahydrofolate reductase [Aminobacter]WMC97366.1 methylenetetrahydrofolate reductase [Aminobacter aminovorans]MBA8908267.1 methylenetetrahydrofolate reductase (NADPH) [Aminobacter ciceronei]MBA9022039.1 methylenetetrahydrofolate reductase (NADPH) [Aminobacter ciceronei]MRX34585.1 methylenetetrahydrofolate reductase [Aminobacter sp. MDW-2]QNH34816.1 methylenetetrahydrofolate reductase [Aminobacter sp. MDW-2]